jgi:hypothetical protein
VRRDLSIIIHSPLRACCGEPTNDFRQGSLPAFEVGLEMAAFQRNLRMDVITPSDESDAGVSDLHDVHMP